MSVSYSVYLPSEAMSVQRLRSLMGNRGWSILAYRSLSGTDAQRAETTAEGVDIIGWEKGATDAETVAAAVAAGNLDGLYDAIGVCALGCTAGEGLAMLIELSMEDLAPRLAKRLAKARCMYTVDAPIGSPAQATPDLQDALCEALSRQSGALKEIDGELS